jgi:hypothetical protein
MNNFDLGYRPLVAGVSIVNGRVGEPGTLGFLAADDAGQRWIVSCYHVLCDAGLGPFQQSDAIYQPAAVVGPNLIAMTDAKRADATLDCAAALLQPGIACTEIQLGIGKTGAVAVPAPGMRVVKAGAESGITEGTITTVFGTNVSIEIDQAFPVEYQLSAPGDSGALWVEQQSRSPVALHTGRTSARRAQASAFGEVLRALGLATLS